MADRPESHGRYAGELWQISGRILIPAGQSHCDGVMNARGKSTLVRQILPDAPLLTLNNAPTLAAAKADPVGFVRQNAGGLLAIDEVQRAPELILAIQDAVEEDRRPGRFLLTGSANLLNLRGAQESLAGRAETVELFGLSQGEVNGRVETLIDRLLDGDSSAIRAGEFWLTRAQYAEIICAGSYPEPRLRTGVRRRSWFNNYLSRVLTRDAVDVSRLPHLEQLPKLLSLLAAQSSGELVRVVHGLPYAARDRVGNRDSH
jgi:hypothetical protein